MIKVFNPADGSCVGEVPHFSREEAKAAVDRVCAAFPKWSSMLARQRSDILRRWFELVRDAKPEIAEIMIKENGKCRMEALGEIDYGLGFIEWYGEEAKRIYGDTIPTHDPNAEVIVRKEPVGPVAAITPWNFPFMMITRKAATALAAGCTMLIKPAEETPLTAQKLLQLARQAGIPEGVLEIVNGDPAEIGEVITSDPRIKKISFTGSTAVGKLLARNSAATLKKLTMELGGNAPFLIFADSDIEAAVKGLVGAKLRNSGQVCISPNRIYVEASVFDEVVEKTRQAVQAIEVSRGDRDDFVVGPLINKAAVEKVDRLVKAAVAGGARVVLGGKPHALGALFYEPTVLTGVTHAMEITGTEVFGPVFSFHRFETEDEAISAANDTEYGLVAYAFTSSLGRGTRLQRKLQAGMVILNSGSVGTVSVPFGGIKQSGYGREGSYYGIEEYVYVKYVLVAGANG